jgi:hypothetical protein
MISVTEKESIAEKILKDCITKIEKMQCLVGISSSAAPRTDKEGKPAHVNNAQLLFWHTKGSPLHGYPARPVVEPAIEAQGNKEAIAEDLAQVADLALDGNSIEAEKWLNIAGQDAVDRIKLWFFDPRNGWAPDAPMTIKRKGSAAPMVDSSQLMNHITYSIRKES